MQNISKPHFNETAIQLEQRIDDLPMSRHLWSIVFLLSLGTFFETYELALTSLISPGLAHEGIFARANGLFGLPDQATFAAATFLGMFFGALLIGQFADRIGRKHAFTGSILLYSSATLLMAVQSTAVGIDLCRFIAGVGLGAEIVTADAYIAEIVPARYRGRAFGFATFIQFVAVPVGGGLSLALVPHQPLGFEGWRWVCVIGGVGGLLVLLTRMRLPESPRWLAQQGLIQRAAQIVDAIEKKSGAPVEPLLHMASTVAPESVAGDQSGIGMPRLFDPAWRGRVWMLTFAHIFVTIGFFGLANWLPSLLEAQGHSILKSFQYSLYIGLCYPLCPLLFILFADKVERKWQIAGATFASAILGICFSQQTESVGIVIFGLSVTACNLLTAVSIHTYQSELFPSAIRARAVGFVYSWGRLAAAFSSLVIGYLLQTGGTNAVFIFLAACLVTVAVVVSIFGPRTLKTPKFS